MTIDLNLENSDIVNATSATFELLGDRLTLAVLRDAFLERTCRFNQWLEHTGAPPAILADRLNALVLRGVFHRVPQPDTPERYEYQLTELGLSTWQILVCLWGWQREWTSEGAGEPELVHEQCGHRGPAVVVCWECDNHISARNTVVEIESDAVWSSTSGARRRSSRLPSEPAQRGDMQFNTVMEAIGDRWSALVTGYALAGARRFGDFRAALDVSPTTLTDRLSRLCAADILRKCEPGQQYRLTARGMDLFGVYASFIWWSGQAFPDATGRGLVIRHRLCDALVEPVLKCRGCNSRLNRTSVRFDHVRTQ